MRAVVQRVRRAAVQVDGELLASIGRGLVAFVAVGATDADGDAVRLARKIAGLRVFPDERGPMNRSVLECGGEVLAVSQFTLFGDVRRGKRPSFVEAAPPARAEPLYERFLEALRESGVPVAAGRFRAMMAVELVNDGPVTILLDTDRRF